MSTLDGAGNCNGEVPTHLWKLAEQYPCPSHALHFKWLRVLERKYRRRPARGQAQEIAKIEERERSWLSRVWLKVIHRFTLRG